MSSYKLPLAAGLAAFFFALGWYAHPSPPVVTVAEEHKIQATVAETKLQTVNQIVTKTVTYRERKPNGATKTVRTVEVAKVQARTERTADRRSETVDTVHKDAANKNWSVGVDWQPRLSTDVYKPVAVEVGYRVGGPIWVTGSYNWQAHLPLVGVRLEF